MPPVPHNGVMKALIIKADGSPPHRITIGAQAKTYDVIKQTVSSDYGDWFDCVRGETYHGYVNDTGLVDGLPQNYLASILFGQVICGDTILFGSFSPEGEYDGNEYTVPEWVVVAVNQHYLLWKTNTEANSDREALKSRMGEILQ